MMQGEIFTRQKTPTKRGVDRDNMQQELQRPEAFTQVHPSLQGTKYGISVHRRAPPAVSKTTFPLGIADLLEQTALEQAMLTELFKEDFKQRELNNRKVAAASRKSQRLLLSISSIFPFDIFPTRLIIEESRLSVQFRSFFATGQLYQIDIKDISNVHVEYALWFASLKIMSRTLSNNVLSLTNLYRKEAIKAKAMIEGLRIFLNENVDTSLFEIDELKEKLVSSYTVEDRITNALAVR